MSEQAVYFEDLSEDVQRKIRSQFNTTPEREFWDLFPLVIIKTKKANPEKE